LRRCIVPVDGFFEWRAIKGQWAKQLYAIAMKDGAPFGIGGIWENWRQPASGEWVGTFAITTTPGNELVADIHDRMPLILAPGDYARRLGEEPDPRDLMRPFPAAPMRMWPISTRVNAEKGLQWRSGRSGRKRRHRGPRKAVRAANSTGSTMERSSFSGPFWAMLVWSSMAASDHSRMVGVCHERSKPWL
jgi:hypothetical protein